jgi:hypothetical protein
MSAADVLARLRAGEDTLSDVALVAEVGEVVEQPRVEPADSFVLHAPLELVARTALLPRVAPDARAAARRRLVELGTEYAARGPAVTDPPPDPTVRGADATRRLVAALAAGDLDAVDAAAAGVAGSVAAADLASALAAPLVPSLAAAAHAPIFLFELPRVAPRGELPVALLRPLARELARHPDWSLTWHEDVVGSAPRAGADELFEAIAAAPQLGVPGSDFIYPVMSQAEQSGAARSLLADVVAQRDPHAGGRAVLRAAALSMLSESPEHAPYGWTHCLTLPQAVLGVASACEDPVTPVAVAATFVVGFRAAFARQPLPERYDPPETGLSLVDALEQEPATAAATAWHLPDDALAPATETIVSRAAVHRDAHFVKYTLACLDAAADDPPARRLYLAAAASLSACWAARDRG